MEITIAGDRSCALRLLGFLQTTKGVRPALSVFGDADMGAFAEAYMNACKEKGLRWSSLANYVNSFVSLTRYVHSTMDEPPSETLDELIRLRSQAESQAKVERLFTPRDKNWIDWEDAQKARVAAETAYRSAKGSAKLKVLKEWTLISCFTVMPPDRVGIVRLLRLGGSLKKEKDGFVLDLTATKLHKTSRFHGPSITTISPLLNEQLSAMCTQLTFDNVEEGKQPYLWHVASDATRPVASSAFTKMVKDAFLKYGGKATPPKVLRASFITWLRQATDAPEVLKAAAKCQRHAEETQASDRYDKKTHDKLTSAATSFVSDTTLSNPQVEKYARSFSKPIPPPNGWMVIEAAPFYEFVKGDGGFVCTLPWCPAFGPEKLFRFHMLPGVPEGLTFKIPCDTVGKAVQVSVQSTAKESFTVFQLLQKAGDEIATTEPVLDGPLVIDDDDDEWTPLDGSWIAIRTPDGFIVKLSASHDERLTGGAEVRFTKADGCDIAEVITRLPLVLEADIVLQFPVSLSSDKEEETVSGLEVRQPPSIAQVSNEKPPIPEATAVLEFGAAGFMVSTAARNGDCFITSSMAGRELKVEEVQKPTMDTLDTISDVRESVFDLLVGDTIGGLDSSHVREQEKVPTSKEEAATALSDWKTQGFWHCPEGENLSAFFLFGLSVKLGRPLLVFEVNEPGGYNADARLYGAIDTDGLLRRTTREPVTIPSYFTLPHAAAIAMLSKDVSALRYDRSALHFDPILKKEATLATEAPAPQPP
eukprot:1637620-Prymnesium_polylepis.1